MIKILDRNSRYAPVMVCDICGKIIDDANRAAVVHKRPQLSEDLEGKTLIDVIHVHKGKCHDVGELNLGGKERTGWIELETHLRYLIHNVGMNLEEMKEQNDIEDNYGIL